MTSNMHTKHTVRFFIRKIFIECIVLAICTCVCVFGAMRLLPFLISPSMARLFNLSDDSIVKIQHIIEYLNHMF